MDGADALSTLAEVAMAFTGFAGLLTVFRHQQHWQPIELYAVQYLLLLGISASLFALLPLPMFASGMSDALAWRICAGLLGAWLLLLGAWYQWIRVRERFRPRSPRIYWTLQSIGFLASFSLFGAASSPRFPWAGIYLGALFWMVLVGMAQFMVQVLRSLPPLGK